MSRNDKGTIERALELAQSGKFASVDSIRAALKRDGCTNVDAHLTGLSILRQLRGLIASASIVAAPSDHGRTD